MCSVCENKLIIGKYLEYDISDEPLRFIICRETNPDVKLYKTTMTFFHYFLDQKNKSFLEWILKKKKKKFFFFNFLYKNTLFIKI
jgi:hypothetical protein